MKHLLYVILAIIALTACTTTQYVPVEKVRTEYRDLYHTKTDSVYVSDSVFIREKGDTILIEKYHYLYRDRLQVDTAYVCVTDSIEVPYPVPAQLTRWQKFRMEFGGIAFWILLAAIGIGIVYQVIKHLRH